MKKYISLILLIFFIFICLAGLARLNSNEKINWPDFIKLNNKFYINRNMEINTSNIDNKVGIIESNSPKKSCKWSPLDNESGKLPIGTEIYNLKDKTLMGLSVYIDEKYIYYEEISEDEFYNIFSNIN